MRVLKTALLILGLALWSAQAFAQPPKPGRSPATQLSQSPPPILSSPSPQLQPPPAQAQPSATEPVSAQPPQPTVPLPTAAQPTHYSADALYNLANSYARAGKPGLAVLHYERAALLAPGDPDINANLEYVLASAHVPPQPRTRLTRIVAAAPPTLAAWIGVLGIALAGASLLARKFTPRFGLLRASSILLGVTLIALTISNAMLLWPRMHEAVILVNQTPARVSPVPMGDTAFVLSEAETVTITAAHEDFILIRTRGGLSGWVARASLAAVVP